MWVCNAIFEDMMLVKILETISITNRIRSYITMKFLHNLKGVIPDQPISLHQFRKIKKFKRYLTAKGILITNLPSLSGFTIIVPFSLIMPLHAKLNYFKYFGL